MKKAKTNREWHTSNNKIGMGDFYGTAIKQKVGRMRDNQLGYMDATPKQLKTPPKSLA
jgi:hypothetical protein